MQFQILSLQHLFFKIQLPSTRDRHFHLVNVLVVAHAL